MLFATTLPAYFYEFEKTFPTSDEEFKIRDLADYEDHRPVRWEAV
jgi:hypothetical protein